MHIDGAPAAETARAQTSPADAVRRQHEKRVATERIRDQEVIGIAAAENQKRSVEYVYRKHLESVKANRFARASLMELHFEKELACRDRLLQEHAQCIEQAAWEAVGQVQVKVLQQDRAVLEDAANSAG